jgi:hypothetical protein
MQVKFDKVVGPAREQLEALYPVDNHPRFPGKRIYTNSSGTHWDLSTTRLNVWAAHLVSHPSCQRYFTDQHSQGRKTATLEKPPLFPYFDIKQQIHPPKTTAITNHNHEVSVLSPAPAPTATNSLLELLTLSIIQQQQAQLAGQAIHTQVPRQPLASLPSSPNVKSRHRSVSMDEFCTTYSDSASDRERLERLEYCPGDAIHKLEREDWQGQAGFSKLAWDRILEKHQEFLKDVRQGRWS